MSHSASTWVPRLREQVARVIVGQQYLVDRLLVGLLANGHVLLEGVPGLAKTLSVRTLAQAIRADFSRVQFTPDLLPADIVGTLIYNPKDGEYHAKKGPIFAHFVLADEINRAPAKVQSALLEAMQERQVTLGGETHRLPSPFLVLATQNPIDQEGTYMLPEAQVDRFMLKVVLDYPKMEEEKLIIRANVRKEGLEKISKTLATADVLRLRELTREIYLDEKIEQYIVDLVFATRNPSKYGLPNLETLISFGCSPRASINLALAGKAHAFLNNRAFVIPEDIRAVAVDVMQHRIGLSYEAEAENMTAKKIVEAVINRVDVP